MEPKFSQVLSIRFRLFANDCKRCCDVRFFSLLFCHW